MAQSVIVVGASGNFGPYIVQALISHKSSFNRIAILSAPEKTSKFTEYASQGVEIVVGSYSEVVSFEGFDVVISLTGNAIMVDQPAIIDAAVAAGVRHFLPSEFGLDIGQAAYASERYFQDKHLTRNHLQAKATEVPGFKYTFVIIGGFAETFALTPYFGVDAKEKTVNFYGDADTEIPFSSMPDTARYTVESLLLPFEAGQSKRELRVPNGIWKIKDAIKTLEEVLKVKYKKTYIPVSVAREQQEKCRVEGDTPMELLWNLKALFGSSQTKVPGPFDNEMFNFKQLSLEEMFASFKKYLE